MQKNGLLTLLGVVTVAGVVGGIIGGVLYHCCKQNKQSYGLDSSFDNTLFDDVSFGKGGTDFGGANLDKGDDIFNDDDDTISDDDELNYDEEDIF